MSTIADRRGSGGLQIIATLNTQKVGPGAIEQLVSHGATILRFNGAHVDPSDLARLAAFARESSGSVDLMVDLPGNKIRTTGLLETTRVRKDELFTLSSRQFTHPGLVRALRQNDRVVSADGQLTMTVESVDADEVTFRALHDGELMNNKGIHVDTDRSAELPLLTPRDEVLMREAIRARIDYVALSFVRRPEELDGVLPKLAENGIRPVVKLETREATSEATLHRLLERTEYFLIDRGDLSSEVGIDRFPAIFERTVDTCLARGRSVFVATHLFASMCKDPAPSLSEVMEFHRLLRSGVQGFQLSEETTIGDFPLETLDLMRQIATAR